MSQLGYDRARSADEFEIPHTHDDLCFDKFNTLLKVADNCKVPDIERLMFHEIENRVMMLGGTARGQWVELSNLTERMFYEYMAMKKSGNLFDATGVSRLQMWEDKRVELKGLLGL
jgi:hypothetical protein